MYLILNLVIAIYLEANSKKQIVRRQPVEIGSQGVLDPFLLQALEYRQALWPLWGRQVLYTYYGAHEQCRLLWIKNWIS